MVMSPIYVSECPYDPNDKERVLIDLRGEEVIIKNMTPQTGDEIEDDLGEKVAGCDWPGGHDFTINIDATDLHNRSLGTSANVRIVYPNFHRY